MSRRARRLTSLLASNRCRFLRLIKCHPPAAYSFFGLFTVALKVTACDGGAKDLSIMAALKRFSLHARAR